MCDFHSHEADSAVVDKDGGEGEGGFAEIERSVEHTLGPSDSGLIQDGECVNPPEKETVSHLSWVMLCRAAVDNHGFTTLACIESLA